MVFISCSTEINEPDIIKATLIQESSTKAIDTEANKIVKTTKVPSVKNSAKIIIVENDKLKSNIDVLAGADKALIEKDREIQELKKKNDSYLQSFIMLMQIIGTVCIPIGVFCAFRFSKGWLSLSGFGICLLISGRISQWIISNNLYVFAFIGVVILYAAFKAYKIQNEEVKEKLKAVKSAVELVDKLKPHVKKETADKFLGHGGSIKNDPITKKIIDKYRKL